MNFLFKSLVLLIPLSFLAMFYVFLTNEDSYPGADYKAFDIPEFQLENLENTKLINNNNIKGNYILNVWASWCITCLVEHPYLMNLKNQGINLIGLNYKDERKDANEWLDKYGNPYEIIIYDLRGSLALDLGVTGAPETFLISNGRVIAHYQGEINETIWKNIFIPIIKEKEMF
tara:strand:+ start:2120 stop:2641 length:522 start_codon:yes stop_codon:yes gene_type:complete